MIISETFLETCQTNPWEKNQEKFIISIFVDQIYHFFSCKASCIWFDLTNLFGLKYCIGSVRWFKSKVF